MMTPGVTDTNQSFDFRKNSLNTLKILAALQVACQHARIHMGVEVPAFFNAIIDIFMGVPIFFILSGFLIWNSIGNSSSFKEYAYKRVIRIYPELWIGVFLSIATILIFYKKAINWLMLLLFTITQSTVLQFWTPDFLRDFGCGTPNGTLWTICVTVQFYVVAWFLFKLLKDKRIHWWISVLAISIGISYISPLIVSFLPTIIGKLYGQTILPYAWMFILGAFLARYQNEIIPFLKKWWWAFIVVSFVVGYFHLDPPSYSYGIITYSTRVIGLIGLCYNTSMLNIKFDFSYGLFIYHMIVVNLMIEFGFVGEIYHMLIAIVISVILAIGSTFIGNIIAKKFKYKKVVSPT